jgi:hypothetical protein
LPPVVYFLGDPMPGIRLNISVVCLPWEAVPGIRRRAKPCGRMSRRRSAPHPAGGSL